MIAIFISISYSFPYALLAEGDASAFHQQQHDRLDRGRGTASASTVPEKRCYGEVVRGTASAPVRATHLMGEGPDVRETRAIYSGRLRHQSTGCAVILVCRRGRETERWHAQPAKLYQPSTLDSTSSKNSPARNAPPQSTVHRDVGIRAR